MKKKVWDHALGFLFPDALKILLKMKLTLCIILLSFFGAIASESYSQSKKLSIDMKNETVENILETIESKSDFYFLYSAELINVNRKVSVSVKESTIEQILEQLFFGTNINYDIKGRQIILSDGDATVQSQQQKSISGKVTDSSGSPLPGVSVVIKSATIGTVTDIEGKYSLSNVPDNATLVFSFVGMKAQEISASGKTTINVVMTEEAIGIDEVVAVGYGTQKKANLTGSLSTVDVEKELSTRPITNASQALSGLADGVWVSQNSGQPGADGAQIRVRGWGTLNNAEPMVVIDGIEGTMSQVNPGDIKTITVLKDAASSAIYGSRAANGVVLITTKDGNYNKKAQVNFTTYYGVQSLGMKYDLIDNSAEYMKMWNTAQKNEYGSSAALIFPESVINAFATGNDKYKYPNTNFFDYVFENAPISEQNLSISGGNDNLRYYISGNYLNQDGIMVRSSSEKYSLNVNLETKVNNWLSVGTRLNTINSVSESPGIRDVMYWFANGAYPFIAPYTKDGRFGAPQVFDPNTGNPIQSNRSPLIVANSEDDVVNYSSNRISAHADIKLTNYLTFKTNFASQTFNNLSDGHSYKTSGYADTGEKVDNFWGEYRVTNSRSEENNIYKTWFNTLNFDKTFAERHSVAATLGMQVEDTKIRTSYAQKSDPPKDNITQVDGGTADADAGGNLYKLRMLSYFGRVNYAYNNKYLAEFDLRADASSRFKEGNRWGVFPAFSAGWRLGEEDFIKNLSTFSNLKLRASYGSLGNQNVNGYWPYLAIITQNDGESYSYGGTFAPGAALTALVNDNISWETSTTFDVGLDFGFLKDKLTVEVDYFNKVTRDIIVNLPIAGVFGDVSSPYQNVGEMSNKGFEININFKNGTIERDKFNYQIGLNLAYANNEVIKFKGDDSPDQLYLIREGYSYKSLYGYKAIGIFQTDQEASQYMANSGSVPKAGDIKYLDVNGDHDLNHLDKVGLGNTIPKYTFGGNFKFSYKGFDLNFLLQGIAGVTIYTQDAWTQPLGVSGGTLTKRWRDAWTAENKSNTLPRITIDEEGSWNRLESSFWTTSLSYLKLKNIQLGYSVPEKIVNRIHLQKLYLFVNAQNFFTLVNKDYEGFDPERNTFDNPVDIYPNPRTLTFGLTTNF